MSRITVRDLLVNALDEAKLVNRNQPAPANIFISAYTLFQKRLAQYSNTNYLSFARKEVSFKSTDNVMTIGEIVISEDAPEEVEIQESFEDRKFSDKLIFFKDIRKFYRSSGSAHGSIWSEVTDAKIETYFESMPDIVVTSLQEVVRCYCKKTTSNNWSELSFVAYEDFYNFDDTPIYSVKPESDAYCTLYLKDICVNSDIKLIYNEKFTFDLDSTLNIPSQFVSLFTAGLVYDLALAYPRLSETTVAMLKDRLTELEENVRRSSSVNKFVGRDMRSYGCSYVDFCNGRFLGI